MDFLADHIQAVGLERTARVWDDPVDRPRVHDGAYLTGGSEIAWAKEYTRAGKLLLVGGTSLVYDGQKEGTREVDLAIQLIVPNDPDN